MNPQPSTVTVWRSGKLAAAAPAAPRRHGLEQMVGAALLALSAVVLAIYVSVLQREVRRSELMHEAQRTGQVLPAPCESDPDALRRGECLAGGEAAAPAVAVSLR